MDKWHHLLRDMALVGTAIFMCVEQALSPHPNEFVLGAAVALTVPTIAIRSRALHGSGTGDSSSPEHAPPEPPSE